MSALASPDITVVIVNWNGGEALMNCLRSIRPAVASGLAKVIVVDNDSRDGSRETAQGGFPEFLIFNSGGNLGFGRANNRAREHVATQYVLFLNPDTRVPLGSLERMVGFLASHPEVGALGCKMRHPDGSLHLLGLQWFPSPWTVFMTLLCFSEPTKPLALRWLPYADPDQSGYVRKLYGGCLLSRKDLLDRVGWFDERYFMYAEDVDLCRSILDAGFELYYLSDTEVFHEGGGTTKQASSSFPILMQCESIGQLMAKYHGWTGHILYRMAVLAGCSLRFAILVLISIACRLRLIERRTAQYGSLRKNGLMVLWSLGLCRPTIPRFQDAPA